MNSVPYVDFFGKDIEVGDKVLYTTNAEGSTLNLGRVLECYESQGNYSRPIKKVKIRRLNLDGDEEMETKYVGGFPSGDSRNWMQTDKPVRASVIDYSRFKILVLE